jgi:hypothetical protein
VRKSFAGGLMSTIMPTGDGIQVRLSSSLLWSVIEALDTPQIEMRGPMRSDIDYVADTLRRSRNVVLHVSDNSQHDARLFELMRLQDSAQAISRISSGPPTSSTCPRSPRSRAARLMPARRAAPQAPGRERRRPPRCRSRSTRSCEAAVHGAEPGRHADPERHGEERRRAAAPRDQDKQDDRRDPAGADQQRHLGGDVAAVAHVVEVVQRLRGDEQQRARQSGVRSAPERTLAGRASRPGRARLR